LNVQCEAETAHTIYTPIICTSMLQVTNNQNTSPGQSTPDTQSPETQALPSAAVKLSVALLHCLWETGGGLEIAPAVPRHVSCWENVLQYIHWGWSGHRRCFAGNRRFSSKCRKLPVVAVTVPWCSPSQLCDSDHTAHSTQHTAHSISHTAHRGEERQAWVTSQGILKTTARILPN
jgi:hypothetical protein